MNPQIGASQTHPSQFFEPKPPPGIIPTALLGSSMGMLGTTGQHSAQSVGLLGQQPGEIPAGNSLLANLHKVLMIHMQELVGKELPCGQLPGAVHAKLSQENGMDNIEFKVPSFWLHTSLSKVDNPALIGDTGDLTSDV